MNTWKNVGRLLLSPVGVGILISLALVLIFVPELWEGFLGRVSHTLETTHVHLMNMAHRHLGNVIVAFLLILGARRLWRGSAKGGGKKG